jgi:protein-S-isoprenylcysteine O-methyltransferase Ste14
VAGLAFALVAAFVGLVFVLRIVVQLRRTGSAEIALITGSPGSAEWLAGVLYIVAITLSVGAPEFHHDGALEPIGVLDGEVGHSLGAGLAMAALLATFGAQLAMGDAWRIGVDREQRTRLVTGFPFSFVRNPIFSGMIAFFVGISLLVPNAAALAGAFLLLAALELQVRLVEEPYLMHVHGQVYADYAARVGRFLPGVGRLRRNPAGARGALRAHEVRLPDG